MHQKLGLTRINYSKKNMKDFQQLFNQLEKQPLPVDLFEKVVLKIDKQQLFKARLKLVSWLLVLTVAIILLVPAIGLFRNSLIESGFDKFFSLLFSDFKVVSVYWQSFVLTLLESLPIMSLVACLAIVLVILEALKFSTKEFKNIFKFSTLTNH